MKTNQAKPPINTGASARWKGPHCTLKLFQQFREHGGKLLKRLGCLGTSLHRAKATVLMGACGNALGIGGFAVALLLAAAGSALATVHYVDVNSTNATPPYTNWATAATSIQDAVDAAVAGEEIVVTKGTYNPVDVNKPLNIRSLNGALIDGGGMDRCVSLASGATLSGFTLANGLAYGSYGGGAGGGTLNNCTLIGNQAINPDPYAYDARGGGAYQCTLNNCILNNNSADSVHLGQAYGGGAYGCTLNNCTLSGNRIDDGEGGGAAHCTLNNCTLTGNSGLGYRYGAYGGGAGFCTLNNCTLTGNSAPYGGGTYGSTLNNCIAYFNTAQQGANYAGGSMNYCCTTPDPGGIGDITNAPLFAVGGNLRLQPNSPCINAGNNSYAPAGPDLDGNPRIAGGTVDIGAYEFQSPASRISYAWLQQYGLPINPSTDSADPDGDGVDNYREWLAGTNPTNPFSSPAQLTITPSGVPPSGIILTWSTNAVGFTLQSTTNLAPSSVWSTNSPAPVVINGQNAVTNRVSGVQRFYRLIR